MAFSKAALCRLPAFFENLPAFSKLQGDRFAQDCTLSHAVPSLCAMVKLTYGRANRDKVSPPDTLTIAAQERRTPRGKSAPTQICWKPPTAPSRWYSLRQSKLCPELG